MAYYDQHATAVYAAPEPEPGIDKSKYYFFGTAGGAGNTDLLWLDESGNNRHLTATEDDYFVLTTDAQGKPAYLASEDTGGVFKFPPVNVPNNDYTVYIVVRPTTSDPNPYLLDAGSHSLSFAYGTGDLAPYFRAGIGSASPGTGVLSVAPNEKAVLAWRMTEGVGGRVYKNRSLVFTGAYTKYPLLSPLTFGHDWSTYYAPFLGYAYALIIRVGNDTDAEFAAMLDYLDTL
ncbi:hypothetical protein GCM10027048_27630 [Hymenobacter coalescens]